MKIECFSSILRRFLCSGSLRTHPFDCAKEAICLEVESDHHSDLKIEEKLEASVTPGLVARLMGLETMPDFDSISTKRTTTTKGSIRRSRSVNAADYLSEFDTTQAQHRRVKTSLSLGETPSFLQEEDDYLVLSFENENVHQTKGGHGNGKKVKKRDKRSMSKTNASSHLETRSTQKNEELESNAENSSPVSVLDLMEFTSEPESLLSEEDSKLKGSNSRRKLSTKLANSEYQSWSFTHNAIEEAEEPESINAQANRPTKMGSQAEDYSGVWGEVCKLTEEEMQKSKWIVRQTWKIEDLDEVRIQCGLQILDHLIHEFVVTQLVEHRM